LSAELDTAQGARTDLEHLPNAGKKSKDEALAEAGISTSAAQGSNQHQHLPNAGKKQTLAEAGISTSAAQRYEELAGGNALPNGGKSKTDALAEAGISTSAAQRYAAMESC
jgi:hypothetical protein